MYRLWLEMFKCPPCLPNLALTLTRDVTEEEHVFAVLNLFSLYKVTRMELYTVVTSDCWNSALLCLLTRTKVDYLYYSFHTSVQTWNSCCFSGTLWRHFMSCSLEDLFITGEVKFLISTFSLFTLIKTNHFFKIIFYNNKITTILSVWL